MVRLNASQIRRRIKKQVDAISIERLPLAEDFLTYLRDRDPNPATRELLRVPGLLNEIRKAEREAERGLLTPVGRLRRKR